MLKRQSEEEILAKYISMKNQDAEGKEQEGLLDLCCLKCGP
jgi:hypothetical protein